MTSSSSKERLYSNSGKPDATGRQSFYSLDAEINRGKKKQEKNRVQRPYRNFCKPYNDRYEPSKESGKDRYGKYQIKQKFKPVA